MKNFKSVNNWLADRAAFLILAPVYYKAAIHCYTVNISHTQPPSTIKAGSLKKKSQVQTFVFLSRNSKKIAPHPQT
jgi:hypothetical protein